MPLLRYHIMNAQTSNMTHLIVKPDKQNIVVASVPIRQVRHLIHNIFEFYSLSWVVPCVLKILCWKVQKAFCQQLTFLWIPFSVLMQYWHFLINIYTGRKMGTKNKNMKYKYTKRPSFFLLQRHHRTGGQISPKSIIIRGPVWKSSLSHCFKLVFLAFHWSNNCN